MPVSAAVVGKQIQKARHKKGYKQSYVAEKVELSDQHLSRVENGNRDIYLGKLSKICDLLEISIVEVLAEAEEPMSQAAAVASFAQIISDCSEETIRDMLDICRTIAQIEKRNKTE